MNMDWDFFEKLYPVPLSALRNMRRTGRLAHAHLVASENAEYRNEFPKLIAMLAACPTPREDFAPCGKCRICRELAAGTYPDSFSLMPVSALRKIQVGQDADDPDTMRWFQSMFYLAGSMPGGWKIGVVHEAECLTEQAQNAFLKTLEEPPQKSLFILTTANPSALLPTTRSRCQILRLTDNRIRADFPGKERLPALLVKLFFGPAKSLLNSDDCAKELLKTASALSDRAKETVAERWKARLEAAQYLEKAGSDLLEKRIKGEESSEYRKLRSDFLAFVYAFFGQLVILAEGTPREALPDPEVFGEETIPADIDADRVYRALDYAEDLLRAMRTNANDELAIRSFCLKVSYN